MASLDLQLIPCKMDQSYVSHSYVGYGPYPVVATGRTRYTPDRNGVLHQEHKNLIFIALDYSNNFNSTALFKNTILVPDLAGRPFGDDNLSNLFHVKWIDHMFPTAMLVRGLTWWWLQDVPLIPQTTVEYYTKNPKT